MFKAFRPKLPQQEQGFTLVEVLVAILITSLFVAVAMQGTLLAAFFKVRARQLSEATTWIQADLENVKNQAAQVPYTSTFLTVNAAPNATQIIVASVNGLQVGDRLKVGTDSTNNVIQSINTITSTITLNANLGTDQANGAAVMPRCDADISTGGFANYLAQNLPSLSNGGTKTITGKVYALSRSFSIKNIDRFEVLELTYSVAPQDAHTTLTAPALVTSTTLNVASVTGFRVGDKLTVGTATDNTVQSVSVNNNTINLTNQLGSNQLSGAGVDVSTKILTIVNTEVISDAAFQCPQS